MQTQVDPKRFLFQLLISVKCVSKKQVKSKFPLFRLSYTDASVFCYELWLCTPLELQLFINVSRLCITILCTKIKAVKKSAKDTKNSVTEYMQTYPVYKYAANLPSSVFTKYNEQQWFFKRMLLICIHCTKVK